MPEPEFTSIEELGSVEEKIQQLEALKTSLKSEAALTQAISSEDESVGKESIEQAIEKIQTVVEFSLESESDETALENVQALILEFGSMPALVSLEAKLNQRKTTSDMIRSLEVAERLESQLDLELELSELSEISQKIKGLPSNAQEVLLGKLSSQIAVKRSTIEPLLKDVLAETNWLSLKYEISKTPPVALNKICTHLKSLILLQAVMGSPTYPDTWWGLDILLQPVITRFNYHFNTANKETNKLSKPEWAFAFVETFLKDNLDILNLVIGKVFRKLGKIAEFEVITTLLKPLREKVLVMIKLIDMNFSEPHEQSASLSTTTAFTYGSSSSGEKFGRLLSHLIFELSSFDQRIKSAYHYNPYLDDILEPPKKKWIGLTADVLVRGNDESTAVRNWLSFERELALKRFQSEILELPNAYEVDYDFQISHETIQLRGQLKPTFSAYNLVRLIDNLTSHFQTLGVVKYQLKYVSTIHLHLIDEYCDNLNKLYKRRFDKFNQSRVLKAIPGSLSSDSTAKPGRLDSGQALVESFKGVYCSAKFISSSVEEWSLELVFIQLWNAYKGLSTNENEYSSIFDSSIAQYEELVNKCISTMEAFFKKEIKALLKEYVNTSQWNIPDHDQPLRPTSNISALISNLPVYLESLQRAMSQLDYYYLTDKVVSLIALIILEYLVTNNQFTRTGVRQLRTDVNYITRELNGYLSFEGGELDYGENKDYLKLIQSLKVLESTDLAQAKKGRSSIPAYRSHLGFETSQLRNSDLNDLLLRIL